jgi:hypothetical protein
MAKAAVKNKPQTYSPPPQTPDDDPHAGSRIALELANRKDQDPLVAATLDHVNAARRELEEARANGATSDQLAKAREDQLLAIEEKLHAAKMAEAEKIEGELAEMAERHRRDTEKRPDLQALRARRRETEIDALDDDEVSELATRWMKEEAVLDPYGLQLLTARLRRADPQRAKAFRSELERRNALRPWLTSERGRYLNERIGQIRDARMSNQLPTSFGAQTIDNLL